MSAPNFGYLTAETLPLFTDLYELTMMQGYRATDHEPEATFQLYFRDLPPARGYVVAAGLEQALAAVESLSFGDRTLTYLADLGFEDDFLDYLAAFSFSGEIRAVPEGTAVFPNEPLLEVTAPIPEAQFFETLFVNQVGFQSLIATKAARMADAVERFGDDQTLVDFGSRRAHGTDAGIKAARAAYVGGFDGTSNVAAGEAFDLPAYGTMAHSWVQSFDTEREAFEAFASVYGDRSVLLVDTYDTVRGARRAMEAADAAGVELSGVRLDSGDLTALSKEVAEIVGDVGVFVSSGLDEYEIEAFLRGGGVATGFAPGTSLVTSEDAPTLDPVYKLAAVGGEPSMKLSTGKETYPGAKSVRRIERDGTYERDVLARRGEDADGDELLETVVKDGERVVDCPPLDRIRDRTLRSLRKLPEGCRRFRNPDPYGVEISDGLRAATDELRTNLSEK